MAITTPHIPEDIVVCNILPKFPVKSLMRFGCVCKLWYNTINHDPDFLTSHSLQSQKNPRYICTFHTEIRTLSPILPNIVLLHILRRLPIKSLNRFGCVCKLWFNLTKDQDFIDAHEFTQSRTDPNLILDKLDTLMSTLISRHNSHYFYLERDASSSSVNAHLNKIATRSSCCNDRKYMVGYCNGFVCFKVPERNIIEICNPSRREILTISSPSFDDDEFSILIRYGFGFDSVSREYKVVCIDKRKIRCKVFTLGTNSWREINIPSPQVSGVLGKITYTWSIFCDEALFWRTWNSVELVLFDLHKEEFQIIQFPTVFDSSTNCYRQLDLKGSLCIESWEDKNPGSKNNYNEVHLYTLKDKTKQVWIKESFLLPFVTFRCDFIVDFYNQVFMYWSDDERVHFYNLCTKERRVLQPPGGLYHDYFDLNRHVENFLSLKTFVHKGAHGKFGFADFYPH